MASVCPDRSLCLHLKSAFPGLPGEAPRVPLIVFRDRVAARGGVARVGDQGSARRLLFGAEAVERANGDALAAVPLTGPAGVVGLLAILRARPLGLDELEAVRELANVAILAIRIADLTSRQQRAASDLDEVAETRADVEGLLHAILYGSPEYAVVAEDLEGNITVFSEGARTIYGYTPDELIGRTKADLLIAPEEIESGRLVEILDEAMATGRCEAVVTRLRKNGERFPARATFTVRRDAEGDPSGFVVVERDLSIERTSAQLTETSTQRIAELQDLIQALKSSNKLLEKDVIALRRENADQRARLDRLSEVDELNAIRIELIKDLRQKLAVTTEVRDRLAARLAGGGSTS